MAQITIEKINPYIPYGIKIDLSYYDDSAACLSYIDNNLNGFVKNGQSVGAFSIPIVGEYDLHKCKLLLRPLSHLTREIEHNGKRFVPIVELAKIAENDNWFDNEVRYKGSEQTYGVGWTKGESRYVFAYSTTHNGFYLECVPYRQLIIANQQKLFQKLAEWHLDFQGLIEQGLALPIQ